MKKKILSFLLVLFLGFSVFLTGCKEDVLGDNPATNANVISKIDNNESKCFFI